MYYTLVKYDYSNLHGFAVVAANIAVGSVKKLVLPVLLVFKEALSNCPVLIATLVDSVKEVVVKTKFVDSFKTIFVTAKSVDSFEAIFARVDDVTTSVRNVSGSKTKSVNHLSYMLV